MERREAEIAIVTEALERHDSKVARLRLHLVNLIKYSRQQIAEGKDYHPTLPSAIASAEAAMRTTS